MPAPVPGVDVSWRGAGQLHPGDVLEQLLVARGGSTTSLVPARQPLELGVQHDCLDRVQSGVHPHHLVNVLAAGPVCRDESDAVGELRILRGDGAGVAGRTEVLTRIEAGPGREPESACATPVPSRTLGLCSVFDDDRSHRGSEVGQLLHRCHLTEEVYRDDRLCSPADRSRHLRRIDQQVRRIHVHEDWNSPDP
jgi:hypothetical protein